MSAADFPPGFPFAGVCLDVDGTLYSLTRLKLAVAVMDTGDIGAWAAMERARWEVRRSQPVVQGAEAIASAVASRVAQMLRDPEEVAAAKVSRLVQREWPRLLGAVGPDPAAEDLIDLLMGAGLPFAAASDYPPARKLAALFLADRPWAAMLDASALGRLKPDPAVFLAAAVAMDLAPAEILVVGDSEELDGVAARAAGMKVAILGAAGARMPGQTAREVPEPDYRFASLRQLVAAARRSLALRPPQHRASS